MNLDDYQVAAMRTNAANRGGVDMELIKSALGLLGESGEIVDRIKKIVFHGHMVDDERAKLIEEIGDVLWYLALLASTLNTTLDVAAKMNVDKLFRRYPDGFRTADSVERNDVDADELLRQVGG